MNVTTNIIADVLRPNILPMIWAKAGDSNSRHLNITVAANGIAQAISPAAVVLFNARRFDGQSKSFNGSVNDGIANITLPDWLLEIDGLADCSVTIKVDNAVLTTLDFQIYVQAAQANGLEKTIYYVTGDLVPQTYYLFIGNLPYSFTLTEIAPAGGVIAFDPTNTSATVYQNESRTGIVESGIAVTQQATGTFLPLTGYDTSDATATAADILVGKTAYTADGKVTGTYEPAVLIAKTITENGLYLAEEDNADGFSEVEVNTYVPTFMKKTITANGAYQASDDHVDGYSEVTVEVPMPTNRIAEIAAGTFDGILIPSDFGNTITIANRAFSEWYNLRNVTLSNTITTIGERAFYWDYYITNFTFSNTLTTINAYAFENCNNLKTIILPATITSLGHRAFYDCSRLTSITVHAVIPPTLGSADTLSGTNFCPIYVPAASVDAYKAATNWSAYASRIQAIPE